MKVVRVQEAPNGLYRLYYLSVLIQIRGNIVSTNKNQEKDDFRSTCHHSNDLTANIHR
jgi:hypothetical protein